MEIELLFVAMFQFQFLSFSPKTVVFIVLIYNSWLIFVTSSGWGINNKSLNLLKVDPERDFESLIDIKGTFEFLINQEPCPKPVIIQSQNGTVTRQPPELLVLILIHSAANNFRRRQIIRYTWASFTDPGITIYFLLGAVNCSQTQDKVLLENQLFGDLIQGNFIDSYRNLTYKHVMGLKWFTYFCQDTPVLLKTDDDVFVNTPGFLQYVRGNKKDIIEQRVTCHKKYSGPVIRKPETKWYVSPEEYDLENYPDYCYGFAIIYSGQMALALYREARVTPYFWIDDVHVTGTLMRRLNKNITQIRYNKKLMALFGPTDYAEDIIITNWTSVMETMTVEQRSIVTRRRDTFLKHFSVLNNIL